MFVALETGIPSRNGCRRHPRAESFELHVYYLTYTLLQSSGVPQSVVYPSGSNYRPGAVVCQAYRFVVSGSEGLAEVVRIREVPAIAWFLPCKDPVVSSEP